KTFNSSRTFLDQSATDVHYKVCSNSHILWYDTGIDWQTSNSLIISEDPCSPRKYIDVSCDLSDNPVPPGNAVTATTELVVPYDSNLPAAVANTSMNYTYPTPDLALPIHGWSLGTLELAMGRDANTLNITGGYVIGAYDFFNDPGGAEPNKIQEYRFCCEYTYFQEPENHEFTLIPLDAPEPAWVGNFRFGHSYGLLTDEVLWMFDDWDVDEDSIESFVPGAPIVKPIYLPGLLPYPMGENYVAPAGCEAANIDDTGRVE
ncbi:unnamed protein product, partial [marine sediment metagenome]